jgi:hypothetical protein
LENERTSKTCSFKKQLKELRKQERKKKKEARKKREKSIRKQKNQDDQFDEDEARRNKLSQERQEQIANFSFEANKAFEENFSKLFPSIKNNTTEPWAYPIVIRSFRPKKGFGKGSKIIFPLHMATNGENFHGDNRGFSLDENASSRITYELVADPVNGIVYEKRKKSNPTIHPNFLGTRTLFGSGPKSATEIPSGQIKNIKKGENTISFGVEYSGTNALLKNIPFVPSLDVDGKLKLTKKGNVLEVEGKFKGDDFPNTEAFIMDRSGQKLFLGADVRLRGFDETASPLYGGATEKLCISS